MDRPEVRRPRGQSRPVLMARAASRAAAGRNRPRGRRARPPFPCVARHQCVRASPAPLGGHSGGAPPLPIPNRAVKPARADGTAPCARESRSPPPLRPAGLPRWSPAGPLFAPPPGRPLGAAESWPIVRASPPPQSRLGGAAVVKAGILAWEHVAVTFRSEDRRGDDNAGAAGPFNGLPLLHC